MPAITIPGTSIKYGWQEREKGWGPGMNTNLLVLGLIAKGQVLSQTTTAPPANPDEGDAYIIPAGATGAWSGRENEIAAFFSDAWVYIEPVGTPMYVIDEAARVYYDGSEWSASELPQYDFGNQSTAAGNFASLADGDKLLGVDVSDSNTAKNLTLSQLAASQPLAANHVKRVTDLSTLRALTGMQANQTVEMVTTGRAGLFRWDSSDLSAEVTADTQMGIYVPPTYDTTGASGAWVRVLRDGVVTPEMFGAEAGGDASVNAVSFNAMISMAEDNSYSVAIKGGTYDFNETIYVRGGKLTGAGDTATILSYTGANTAVRAVSESGSGERIYGIAMRDLQIRTTTGEDGLDLDSLSESLFENIIVAGFSGSAVRLHTSTSGGAVYNRFIKVKAQSCNIGFELTRDGAGVSSYTNDNSFIACRTNLAVTGFSISGGNHNIIEGAQIEAGTTGVSISEPATASCNSNTIVFCRFENNTTNIVVGAGVTNTILGHNYHVTGTALDDAGTRTINTDSLASGASYKVVSPYQIADGSFVFERTANGGSGVPNFVVKDASGVNSPVTLQVENVSSNSGSTFFRAKFGASNKFDIECPSGKIAGLSTTNGPVGTFTLDAAASKTVSNTCVSSTSSIFISPYNPAAAALMGSSKALYVSGRTAGSSFQVNTSDGTAAAGGEVFHYWIVN